jgi:hypothetical protein
MCICAYAYVYPGIGCCTRQMFGAHYRLPLKSVHILAHPRQQQPIVCVFVCCDTVRSLAVHTAQVGVIDRCRTTRSLLLALFHVCLPI